MTDLKNLKELPAEFLTTEQWKDQVTALLARIEELEEALTKYGHHTWCCSIDRDPGDGCDCGFDAALKGADRD